MVMRPVENWFVGEQGGAVSLGGTGVGLDGALGEEVAAFRFERPDHLLGQGELRELLRQLCVGQGGVAEIVFFGGEFDAADRLAIGEPMYSTPVLWSSRVPVSCSISSHSRYASLSSGT